MFSQLREKMRQAGIVGAGGAGFPSYAKLTEDIDTLIITAGFGRLAPFDTLTQVEITNLVKCNMLASMKIIKKYPGTFADFSKVNEVLGRFKP